jgi:hypothetical protein
MCRRSVVEVSVGPVIRRGDIRPEAISRTSTRACGTSRSCYRYLPERNSMLSNSVVHSATNHYIIRFRNALSSVGATLALLAIPCRLVLVKGI